MQRATLVGGEEIWAHDPALCQGRHCSVHNPSKHILSNYPQHWRSDRGLMERACLHYDEEGNVVGSVGHPDPDHMAFLASIPGIDPRDVRAEGIHGCDGCCFDPSKQQERDNANN